MDEKNSISDVNVFIVNLSMDIGYVVIAIVVVVKSHQDDQMKT